MARKKQKAKASGRKPRPVTVNVPDYLTSFGMPYETQTIARLPDSGYGVEAEEPKLGWMRDEYTSTREFLVCFSHLLLEMAKFEHVAKLEDHDELDRLAHVIAEGYEALIMEQ